MNNKIKEEELIYICRQFTNMFGFPVRLYKNQKQIYSYFTVNFTTDPISLCLDRIMKETADISYFVYRNLLFYGIVNYEEYKFAVGPVSELKLNKQQLRQFAFSLNIEQDDLAVFTSEMNSLSNVHLDTLIQLLILLNFSLNKTMYDISDIRIKNSEQKNILSEMEKAKITEAIEGVQKDESSFFENNARSYLIEKDIIKKVMNGDVSGLMEGATKVPSVSSGQFAPHLLRHQKNFFIKLETIVSRAAIEAGLDIDEVFSIEKNYIIKCESLENLDRIKNLQYHMILDYADRVKRFLQYNSGNSKLVIKIEKYINNHISESIKTSDIADYLGRSRGGLTTEFKKHTNMNLSDFINLKKIQLAEELLIKTNKSFVSISNYLGFSSQSHFCRIFKKIKGITPTEFRKKI